MRLAQLSLMFPLSTPGIPPRPAATMKRSVTDPGLGPSKAMLSKLDFAENPMMTTTRETSLKMTSNEMVLLTVEAMSAAKLQKTKSQKTDSQKTEAAGQPIPDTPPHVCCMHSWLPSILL